MRLGLSPSLMDVHSENKWKKLQYIYILHEQTLLAHTL